MHYGFAAVLAEHVYGLLLLVPVLSAVIAMSLLPPAYWSFFLPFVAALFTVLFLPFGMGNSFVSRVVGTFCPEAREGHHGYIVQLTLVPRLRTGFRAIVEDADDVGFLSFTDAALVFRGDSVRFAIPWENLAAIQPQNVGIRGLFVYGRRIEIAVETFPGASALQFAERSSLLLPASRRVTRRLRDELLDRMAPITQSAPG
jgi:hypothetical protein